MMQFAVGLFLVVVRPVEQSGLNPENLGVGDLVVTIYKGVLSSALFAFWLFFAWRRDRRKEQEAGRPPQPQPQAPANLIKILMSRHCSLVSMRAAAGACGDLES